MDGQLAWTGGLADVNGWLQWTALNDRQDLWLNQVSTNNHAGGTAPAQQEGMCGAPRKACAPTCISSHFRRHHGQRGMA